jgi:effector-binding domain-containing protein
MVVDFVLKRTPSYRVATIVRKGPYVEDNLRPEFRELTKWARKSGVSAGHWIFLHRANDLWMACLEIKGRARSEGRIRLRTLPVADVASVVFNPDLLADRIVYHGLSDWTRVRKRSGEIKSVTGSREIYTGDPWTDKKAWARCEVQFLVKR